MNHKVVKRHFLLEKEAIWKKCHCYTFSGNYEVIIDHEFVPNWDLFYLNRTWHNSDWPRFYLSTTI